MTQYGFNFQWMLVEEGRSPDPADERALDFLGEYDFNFVRIPTNYRVWTSNFDHRNPDETVLRALDGQIEGCRERGIHVALNLHHVPGYCITPDPSEVHNLWQDTPAQDAFVFLWELLATRYRDYSPAQLSFDLINEPPELGMYGFTRPIHEALIRRTVAANVGGARTAVEHLIARGHREIGILATEPQAYPSILQRRRGYEQVMADAGLSTRYVDAPYFPPEAAAEAGINYLRAHPETTAVFCANDAGVIALLVLARQAGTSVPGQLSVIGFDDIDLAGFVSPALTAMAVDKVGMGRVAVALLADRLDLGQTCVTQTLVKPTLVERETTRTLEPAARHVTAAPALREILPA